MCANYVPVTNAVEMFAHFGVQLDPHKQVAPELYPTDMGPFIRLMGRERIAEAGRFGLLPAWRREVKFGKNTYNSRSETVHSLPSFADSWRRGLRCIVPAKALFEPRYYEDFTNERWRIEREDGTPFGIAGVYSQWVENGQEMFSYTMLTVNSQDHPFYSQFHAPDKEKRMPIVLEPHEYDEWMSCPVKEASIFFRQWMGPMKGAPAPRAPKAAAPKSEAPKAPMTVKVIKPKGPPPPIQGGLF